MWPELARALDGGTVVAYGATPGWAAWLAVQVAERESLVVAVAPDDAAARALADDIRFFWGGARDPAVMLDELAALPGIDVSPYHDMAPDRSYLVERVATLYRLARPELRPRIVATSAEA